MKQLPMRLGQVQAKDLKSLAHSDRVRPPLRWSRVMPSAVVLRLARPLGEEVA